jgi:hypothetical protein
VPHLDPDRLVLLALSEDTADSGESAHLESCAGCQGEIDALQHVAALGAETQGLRVLPPPPEHVWEKIKTQIPSSVRAQPPADRKHRRWLAPALAAAAAAIIAVTGTVVVTRLTSRPPAPTVTARAQLTPLGSAPPTATGNARVLSDDELQLVINNLDDTTKMMSIGNLSGSKGVVLPLPPGADLNRYRLVDISAEAYDGDAAHSGKSLLRGTLTN